MSARGNSGFPFVPWLARISAYLVWLAMALPIVGTMPTTGERVTAAVLLAASGVLLGFFLTTERPIRAVHAYLAVQTVLALAVYLIEPDAGLGVAQIFFVFTAQAVLFLPGRQALPWVVSFAAIVFAGGYYVLGSGSVGAIVATSAGHVIFGGLAAAVRQTQLANRRSNELLVEVREAHDQLRALSETSEQLAVSQERERIAREMHDALGHRLTVAVVQLEGAQRLIPRDPDRAAAMVAQMREQLREGLAELRDTVSALRTHDAPTLQASLSRLVAAFSSATDLSVTLDVEDDVPAVGPELRHALYRACQEGLTNVQRHAGATRVDVTLAADGAELTLRVRDDGRGAPNAVGADRHGLAGIAERIAPWDGTVDLHTRPEGGAELVVAVPAPEASTAVTGEVAHA